MKKALDLFNINYLLVQKEIKELNAVRRVSVREDRPVYYLYRINDSKLVELLSYKPLQIRQGANWDKASHHWFQNHRESRVLIDSQSLPFNVATSSDSVKVIERSESQDYFKLKVDAPKAVPILIKISYFPRFKAYVNGRKTKIFKVAPYQMLVYGKGIVEIKYGATLVDYLGWILTFMGLGSLVFLYFNKGKIPSFNIP